MNLEGLLNAGLELEKRIKTDRMMRRYLSTLWANANPGEPKRKQPHQPAHRSANEAAEKPGAPRSFTVQFPPEMCELLQRAAQASGKSPDTLLEESFAEYYLKHFNDDGPDSPPPPPTA
jgi:hypothetical protein